ncbi:hypothetical protein [Deinococcus sp.]|uniref:hypothetical protein n=1 Tax=Deinococcus sp. TaxID=47478 RepID=UPI0025E40933|nr:hypothetical protein [Deinococcus sp.]
MTTLIWAQVAMTLAAAHPPLPTFETLIYHLFASPYPDMQRSFRTATLESASKYVNLALPSKAPVGFDPIGVWTSEQALEGVKGKAALSIFVQNIVKPRNIKQGRAIAMTVGRWDGGDSAFNEWKSKISRLKFRQEEYKRGVMFSQCLPVNIIMEDYPAIRQVVRQTCTADYRNSQIFAQVTVVNLNRLHAVREMKSLLDQILLEK